MALRAAQPIHPAEELSHGMDLTTPQDQARCSNLSLQQLICRRTPLQTGGRERFMANTKKIEDKAERKIVKRAARKKAAPKPKRTAARGSAKKKVKKASRGQSKR
jgi:hypothetical protein